MLERFLRRIEENAKNPASGPVLIVAFGDSVTQGCMESGRFDFGGVYHNVLKRMLEKRFAKTTFSVINAGVGGESSAGGLKRLKRDVLQRHPDLLLLAFCLNDACGGLAALKLYRSNIEKTIKLTKRETNADIIALTPNFMASSKNQRIAQEHMQFAKTIIGAQKNGILKAYADALKEVAEKSGASVADVYAEWAKLEAKGFATTDFLVNGLNHPDKKRQRLAAKTVMDVIVSAKKC